MKVCVFELSGQYAHWRKWFTTTSALTYSFPPRTAVVGLIGAVLGIPREKMPEVFPVSRTRTAICPTLGRVITKGRLAENWRQSPPIINNGKMDKASLKKFNESFQSNMEILRQPSYMIAFHHDDHGLLDELTQRIREKRWVYQPYLGIMGFLADIEPIGVTVDEAEETSRNEMDLPSVLPLTEASEGNIDLTDSENYVREERIPIEVLPGRQFTYLHSAYVPSGGGSLKVKARDKTLAFHQLRNLGSNVMFLETCVH